MKYVFASVAVVLASAVSFNAYAGGDIEAGKAIAQKTCAACHGADLNSPVDPSYPKLAGQSQDYLEHALTAYKRGGDGPNGRSNAIMGPQAQTLSREDIKNVAAYIHSLPGSLLTHK